MIRAATVTYFDRSEGVASRASSGPFGWTVIVTVTRMQHYVNAPSPVLSDAVSTL